MIGFDIGTRLYRKALVVGTRLDEWLGDRFGPRARLLFRAQTGIARWVGDRRISRREASIITKDQIDCLPHRFEPGDLLLARREWFVSNVAMPGFWKHSALYVGTPTRRQALGADPSVVAWVRAEGIESGDLEEFLRARYPSVYELHLTRETDGVRSVLESTAEGVGFSTLERAAAADSLAILRPQVTPLLKAKAIAKAFSFYGRPYDYAFDFSSDESLICSELIYRCYFPGSGEEGLDFPLPTIAGKPAMPTNEIARTFAETFGTEKQALDLVLFLDGDVKSGKAGRAPVDEFLKTWNRPEWHPIVTLTKSDDTRDVVVTLTAPPPHFSED